MIRLSQKSSLGRFIVVSLKHVVDEIPETAPECDVSTTHSSLLTSYGSSLIVN